MWIFLSAYPALKAVRKTQARIARDRAAALTHASG
jgi:hypothetical protein